MKNFATALLFYFSLMTGATALAQAGGDDNNSRISIGNYEVGAQIGTLLPHDVNGVTEIMGLGGFHGGARISPSGWFEGDFLMGNGSGQTWRNLDANLRMDIPLENLVGDAFFGVDMTQYSGISQSNTYNFGAHVGGGIQALLGGDVFFRSDMKYTVGPGQSLYIGFGFVWRFGSGGGGGQ